MSKTMLEPDLPDFSDDPMCHRIDRYVIGQPGEYTIAIGGSQPGDDRAETPGKAAAFAMEGTAALSH